MAGLDMTFSTNGRGQGRRMGRGVFIGTNLGGKRFVYTVSTARCFFLFFFYVSDIIAVMRRSLVQSSAGLAL